MQIEKSYRPALFAYHINVLRSIPAFLHQYVPMSLLNRDSLHTVLEEVARIQSYASDRLTLAIHFDNILSYYEAQLLQDVLTLSQGLLLTLSIPLASQTSGMTIYEANPLPMPQPENTSALIWEPGSRYFAVSENKRETALVTESQVKNCIGSAQYSICHQGLATEGLTSSCLSLLFFGNLIQAMKVCDLVPYQLPVVERAVNLKFGIWLILSATSDFELRESIVNDTAHLSTTVYPGCRICIYTLPSGHQLRGPNIFIRSDLQTCSRVPSIKIHVDLPVPLQDVLSVLPSIDELPSYTLKSTANLALLGSLKKEMKYVAPTSIHDTAELQQLAQPIAPQMTI